MKMKNKKTGAIINVPFDHAINVLIPQGKYTPMDSMVEIGKIEVPEDDSLEGQSVNEEVTRKELMNMLDAKEVLYRPSERKADLLALVQKAYNIRVNNVNISTDS